MHIVAIAAQKTATALLADKKRQNAEKGKRHKTLCGSVRPLA
jgi:hypothetical protein